MTQKMVITFALGLVLVLPAVARAQRPAWELELHAGAVRNDLLPGDEIEPVFGGGIMRSLPGGFGIGGSFDWIPVGELRAPLGPEIDFDPGLDIDVFRYSLDVDYMFPSSGRTRFVVGSGVGAATTRFDGRLAGERFAGERFNESETNLTVPLGGGVRLLNRAVDPSWALRLDVRDHLVFLDDRDAAGNSRSSEVRNNVQVTAGISFLFGGRRPAAAAAPVAPADRPADPGPMPPRDREVPAREGALAEIRTPIHFDFDRSTIKDEAREVLARKAEAMRELPDLRIRIEGHADERGTVEYNLSLGERRADAARRYLVDLGIDPDRMTIISFGEERPAVEGHNESAWSQNRRAEFVPLN